MSDQFNLDNPVTKYITILRFMSPIIVVKLGEYKYNVKKMKFVNLLIKITYPYITITEYSAPNPTRFLHLSRVIA